MFHRVQRAWEVLGRAESRAAYDRSRTPGDQHDDDAGSSPGGVYSPRGFTAGAAGAAQQAPHSSSRKQTKRSAQADQPPRYEPPLSSPEPLNLALTSQRVHGEFGRSGLFGGGRHRRNQQRTVELLAKHVLDDLPAARLFNDVHLAAPQTDRKGRRRAPRGEARAEHVLIAGHSLVLVASLEVPAVAASWDGRSLRAAGRSLALPDLTAAGRQLRGTLSAVLQAQGRTAPELSVTGQIILHPPDGDLFHPVVETVGRASPETSPLAAGRALGRIDNALAAASTANLVDRHLLAALRAQLNAPES